MKESPSEITFGYVRGNGFRTLRAEGAWGGVTPKQEIFMALWSERPPIPDIVRMSVTDNGTILQQERPEHKSEPTNIVREVEVGLSFDKATAVTFISWLKDRVEELDKIEALKKEQDRSQALK
jgi:hypothetical protein